MAKTFQSRDEAMAWRQRHAAHTPRVGQMAPDFELSDTQGQNPVRLSAFRGQKPVALVFGSAT